MRLLRRYLLIVVQGQLRYRSTLYLNLFGLFVLPLSTLAGIFILMATFSFLTTTGS
jgi:hypothetical protein